MQFIEKFYSKDTNSPESLEISTFRMNNRGALVRFNPIFEFKSVIFNYN